MLIARVLAKICQSIHRSLFCQTITFNGCVEKRHAFRWLWRRMCHLRMGVYDCHQIYDHRIEIEVESNGGKIVICHFSKIA